MILEDDLQVIVQEVFAVFEVAKLVAALVLLLVVAEQIELGRAWQVVDQPVIEYIT